MSDQFEVPEAVLANVRRRWPAVADGWFGRVDAEFRTLCERYQATPQSVLPARYGFVVAVDTAGGPLVFRSSPDPRGRAQAAAAVALAKLGAAPRVHEANTTNHGTWTVLDRVVPGIPLSRAPIDASSGDQNRHRLSRAGNRRINRVLHIMAVVQLRNDTEGRRYYRRKLAQGKTTMEAMRALKRRLPDVVYRQMAADAKRLRTGPGGQAGATLQSSADDPNPWADTSEKSLPGPASPQPRTPLLATS